MNITARQLSGTVSVLAFVGTSAAQLKSIFVGLPHEQTIDLWVQVGVGAAGYLAAILGLVLYSKTGQAGQVAAVEAMSGVSRIVTNPQASAVLRDIAQSDDHPKVEPPK